VKRQRTETRNLAMLQTWQAGAPIVAIAEEYGLSLSWTGRILRQTGAQLPEIRRGVKRADLDADRIASEYRAGASIRRLADEHHTSYGTVYRTLRQACVPLRRHGGQNRRPPQTPGTAQ
jgi:Mor family transcriptional regulator